MKSFRYENIFMYASKQFCGHIEEYFSKNSKRCVVFIIMPRTGNSGHSIRLYESGVLIKETPVFLSSNIFGVYLLWYYHYIKSLFTMFPAHETITVISFHPLSFIGKSIVSTFRKIRFVYWAGDYFPGNSPVNVLFRFCATFYHSGMKYRAYLSDRLNEKMNGKIIDSPEVHTIMWGTKQRSIRENQNRDPHRLCFIGELRDSQGVELLLKAVSIRTDLRLELLGAAPIGYAQHLRNVIERLGIQKRVYFPNRSFYENELSEKIKWCGIGIALYQTGPKSVTYYADPAKIKTYTEYGLPVIMTDVACISQYVNRFHAGITVSADHAAVITAINDITTHYRKYLNGVNEFNRFFSYQSYYRERFRFLEL